MVRVDEYRNNFMYYVHMYRVIDLAHQTDFPG